MNTRILSICLLLLLCTHSFGQKIQFYHTLDSVKQAQKLSVVQAQVGNAPAKSIDSLKNSNRDIKDSIRDEAHDIADSLMQHMDYCSHFEIGLDFASRQLITGRRGPATGPVGTPSLKYIHKAGIYAMLNTDEYKLQYRQVSIQKRPLRADTTTVNKTESDVTIAAGFMREFWEKWDLDASLDHTFIFYGTDRNYLSTSFNFNNSIDFWSYISLDVYYSLLFGGSSKTPANEKKYSNLITLGLSHDIKIYRFIGAKVFTISPGFLVDVGNDNYVRNRLLARNQNGGLEIARTTPDNFFGLLNLTGTINIDYRIRNLDIYVDPQIAIPFNVVPTNALSAASYRNNTTAGPIWYVTAGVKYMFKFWKETPRRWHNR